MEAAAGPLAGIRIVEIAGIGPGPFACMMLADHGAEVIRVERPGGAGGDLPLDPRKDILARNRRRVAIDLKSAEGAAVVRDLVATADGLVEGFRPGVMERLGLGPDELIGANPRLVYGRMTGWGQTGPYAAVAGHDINYIALSGALHACGRADDKPVPPLNLIGDFGGGAMMLAFGMLAAILSAKATGTGQVVDCAMTDGSALLMGMIYSFRAQGFWADRRGVNLLDGGAPFYDTYQTADGGYVAIGAIEPHFYALLKEKAGLGSEFAVQMDARRWPEQRAVLAGVFAGKTRDEWCAIMEGSDVCFAPVLSLDEAPEHPHNVARDTFVEAGGVVQPAPAPRYSATPTRQPAMPTADSDTAAVLAELGYSTARIDALRDAEVVGVGRTIGLIGEDSR
ncbi:alpha-methylacyl-CoA racemase [Sphingomonas jinjuensis]|uniref:Alpha-methylacyl-CoA racemase n=1 Tax=Sphingomonas jinjuensis TaxID=535907 RepID=A0A840FM73_9SPHN|nr:CaiB/BaiF CoA-transferase family protein [Sphingomonas jinjuensis]MBB4154395.1 alpha-methylacyl-CoA racemase [Sphingomonas jinjuensis]